MLGGDSFGDYHARQLRRAGADTIRVVEAQWLEVLREWIPRAGRDDKVVPGPLHPHLLWDWLALELGAVASAVPRNWGLPYEKPGGRGEVYLSAAGWICPSTCIEPAHCPALHSVRDWDLGDIIEARASVEGLQPAVFRCIHHAGGVGAVSAGSLQDAAELEFSAGPILVATTSRCHAAVGCLSRDPNR